MVKILQAALEQGVCHQSLYRKLGTVALIGTHRAGGWEETDNWKSRLASLVKSLNSMFRGRLYLKNNVKKQGKTPDGMDF